MARAVAWLAGLMCVLAMAGCGGNEPAGGAPAQVAEVLDLPVDAANAERLRASIDRVAMQTDLTTSTAFLQALSIIAADVNGALEGIAKLEVPPGQKEMLGRTALRAHYRICMDEEKPGFLAAVAGKTPRQLIGRASELKQRYGVNWGD